MESIRVGSRPFPAQPFLRKRNVHGGDSLSSSGCCKSLHDEKKAEATNCLLGLWLCCKGLWETLSRCLAVLANHILRLALLTELKARQPRPWAILIGLSQRPGKVRSGAAAGEYWAVDIHVPFKDRGSKIAQACRETPRSLPSSCTSSNAQTTLPCSEVLNCFGEKLDNMTERTLSSCSFQVHCAADTK